MAKLENVVVGASVRGIDSSGNVTIDRVTWYGADVLEIVYRDTHGHPRDRLLYRHDEAVINVDGDHRAWSLDADPSLTRLAAEAKRIRLAYNFDPLLAIHSSDVDPLPHQITAVYESMLPRQPLRFLLADDPGAGKTIMTGLYMKELYLRGDLERCLIVCPGSLSEQWQDELDQKFDLPFDIFTSELGEKSRTGNWFAEHNLVICRLDQLSRNEDLQEKLKRTDWDLIVCDEAHKMSAAYFGDELKKTRRYQLGELLGSICRHFLLLSATPHNGREVDFQLFMALLDGDRFEGKYRESVHKHRADDMMRRMVKEDLRTMEGKPLFPERIPYTVGYELSNDEAILYNEVTNYVREQFDLASNLDNQRRNSVGFALTVLQRRLASSPEAIYQSLNRRHERLLVRRNEAAIGKQADDALLARENISREDELSDLEDGTGTDFEERETELADRTTAAQTLKELDTELAILERLTRLADRVRKSGNDKKWEALSSILQDRIPEVESDETRRKLVIFTEHRDTLDYLKTRISNLIGRPEAVVSITGGMIREERRKAQEAFTQDKHVEILLATDAAGEGINLQRAHLMVNYDLPWNPNRLEQRFGRIHRIGQREVCHLWNLVSVNTREGEVFNQLLQKLDVERQALGGKVFDVLGTMRFGDNQSLKDLLVQAIRYGDDREVRRKLDRVIEGSVNRTALQHLLDNNALHGAETSLNVREIAEQMELANARRLQPHYIASFFQEAFTLLGGKLKRREEGRFEISHVPGLLISRDRQIGRGAPLLTRYERITFERDRRYLEGKPTAAFIAPGHPLLDTVVDVVLEQYRMLLRQGTVLIDPTGSLREPHLVCLLEHEITNAKPNKHGDPTVISKRMQFVDVDSDGALRDAGYAPYLDYRPPTADEYQAIPSLVDSLSWLDHNIEQQVVAHAIESIAPKHFVEVANRTNRLIDRSLQAVHERLTHEINLADHKYNEAIEKERAGKRWRLPSDRARQRLEDLQRRLDERTRDLELQRQLASRKPQLTGAMLVVPAALVAPMTADFSPNADSRRRIELAAMDAVMAFERALGNEPRDVSRQNLGFDVQSHIPGAPYGTDRLIEVKGRVKDAITVTISRNEILTSLNDPDHWLLSLVEVDGDDTAIRYLERPFVGMPEPDFSVASVNFVIDRLLSTTHIKAGAPSGAIADAQHQS